MKINHLRYSTRQSYVSISRNFWLAVVTASIIAISLAALGGFLLMAVNANQFLHTIESNLEINVFLEDGADVEAVRLKLNNLSDVESYIFVSKEQGLQDFSRAMGDRIPMGGLEGENNPLPDLFRVRTFQAELVPALAGEIQTFPGVEVADYGEELVGMLLRVTGWLNRIFLGVSILLALGAIFLIVTTVRLSVLARQDEIGIMKYLGASNWFIRFPFLLEGMVMGWAGTLAAVTALGFAYYRVASAFERESLAFFMQPVTDMQRLLPLFAGLLILGTLMGGIGSFVSIRKFLRV
ncbi:MAG: permease-like cell division protein FtsX [Dethiobacter sp.]|jgi:cell division transport system permease protein|nr:permease-like cell division protein FtsX [Dethiobacter sp.]